MKIETENITRVIKYQTILNGPKIIRRGLVDGSVLATKAGIALNDMFISTKRKESNK